MKIDHNNNNLLLDRPQIGYLLMISCLYRETTTQKE